MIAQTQEDWFKIIADKGVTFAIGAAVVYVLVKHGPRLIEAYTNLVNHLQDASERMAQTQTLQGQTLDKVAGMVERKLDPAGDPRFRDHLFSNARTNRALLSHADAILAFAHAHGPDAERAVRPHVDEIKRILGN